MSALPRLSDARVREIRALSGASPEAQRAFAEKLDPKTFKAWKGWTWGRKKFDLELGQPDACPSKVARCFTLQATEYRAAKGKGSRPVTYRHEHDRKPLALVVTTPAGAPDSFACPTIDSARHTPPRLERAALFALGELEAFEGEASDGSIQRIEFRPGFLLCGDPSTEDMHVIRLSAAARKHPPIWILRHGSPYRLTDRGIVW